MKKPKTFNLPIFFYIFIPVAIVAILGLTIFVIVLSLPKYESYDYTQYKFPSEIQQIEYDLREFREFPLLKKTMYQYESYNADIVYDSDTKYEIVTVSEIASIEIGDSIVKGTLLGRDASGVKMISSVNGVIVHIETDPETGYTITCLNSQSYHIETSIPQSDFYKYNIDYSSTYHYVLASGDAKELSITYINYSVVNSRIYIKLEPRSIDYSIMPGTTIDLRYNTVKSTCTAFISHDAFWYNGKDNYSGEYSHIYHLLKTDTGYQENALLLGPRIGDYVGVYLTDAKLTKLLVRTNNL
ncbi:MAG: hypothetical protein LBE09_02575 [Christensenellaceae bacterium]|nr:hypothetical protein [Christensenellaceae bacterium]